MTSPAWVVLFTRISGLVTDAGGMASHPAVVSARVRHSGRGWDVRCDPAHPYRGPGARERVNWTSIYISTEETGVQEPARGFSPAHLIRTTRNDRCACASLMRPACRMVSLSGGKGASIATMLQEGLAVPPGFVVTSAAFMAGVDDEHYELSAVVEIWPAPDRSSRRQCHRQLSSPSTTPCSTARSRCAPRPARRILNSASYAGQQETYLNVDGPPAVLEKIVECWLSFFTDRAVFYRAEKGSLRTSPWPSLSNR